MLAITAIIAARAGRRFGAALAALLVLAAITALWSATRIEDAIVDHEVFWMSGFGVLGTAALLDAAMAAGGERRGKGFSAPDLDPVRLAVGLVAVMGGLLWLVASQTFSPRPQQVAAAALGEALKQRIRSVAGSRSSRIEQDVWPVAAGVLLNLQKSGVPFAVEDDWLPMFTDAAATTGRETEVVEITGRERHFLLTSDGRAVTLAEANCRLCGPFTTQARLGPGAGGWGRRVICSRNQVAQGTLGMRQRISHTHTHCAPQPPVSAPAYCTGAITAWKTRTPSCRPSLLPAGFTWAGTKTLSTPTFSSTMSSAPNLSAESGILRST